MIPSGTRFIGFGPRVDLSERKTANLNSETEPYTLDDIRGYKVFSALLTQSGGDDTQNQQSGLLTIGVTYYIDDNASNPDFTNVGAANNNVGTYFMATGTTPTSWGEATLAYNPGAPVATVLENTIGNIWFTYNNVGNYFCNSDGLFTENKTVNTLDQTGNISSYGDGIYYAYMYNDNGSQRILIFDESTNPIDTILLSKLIEIRVYN